MSVVGSIYGACALTFPVSCSSSFWFFDASTLTPGLMLTLRTSFSPTKFLISTSNASVSLFFSMLTLMGKLDGVSADHVEVAVPHGSMTVGARERVDVLGIDVSHLVLVALGDTDDQVVLHPVSHCLCLPASHLDPCVRRTMRVRTVRRVATLLREPWWSSILMTFFLGCRSLSYCSHVATSDPTYVCEADSQVTKRLCELALWIVRSYS